MGLHSFRHSRLAATVIACIAITARAVGDVVTEWNEALCDYCETTPSPLSRGLEVRAYAMTQLAVFNAIRQAGADASRIDAAGAQAAHDMIVQLLPKAASTVDRLLATQLAKITNPAERTAGINIGGAAATAVLTARANDGAANAEGPYEPRARPGDYQFTPPHDKKKYAATPNWSQVTPFALQRGDQFRAPPPLKLSAMTYVLDFNEVKALGRVDSATRTPDQRAFALFWDQNATAAWNRVARILMSRHTAAPVENARVFAALNIAMTDAGIAVFDSKYAHHFWRPYTAIRLAANDGNELTLPDPDWEPLFDTPPHPEYPAAHACLGAAAAAVLIAKYGDEHRFTLSTTMTKKYPELQPRTYGRISAAAEEMAISRVFAGVHFRQACVVGFEQGRKVGALVNQHPELGTPRLKHAQ
jgi:membrane-associated phospholipid phosphatase